ncbi:MAG TPA: SDR family oxidoreductase [Thermoanaerobaculia bacterium]
MSTIFFTGFPGFLGSELLPRVLSRADDVALCLVQPKFRALAETRAGEIIASRPELAGRIEFVEGDLTQPLDHVKTVGVREIYHLAAIYDLAVARDLATRVNVLGTIHLLDLAGRAQRLERLHYISTCYVSGRYPGHFLETDLQKGQTFNNYYEATKMLAEMEVRQRLGSIPTTIYRPSVVVGDRVTGATQKYDGPYFVMQWLLRQPRIAVLPVVGSPSRHRFNVVPRDFIIDAIDRLSSLDQGIGKTYALADPLPLTVDETIDTIAEATGRRVVRIPMTRWMAKQALQNVPGVYSLLRIPPEAVDYFVHPATYDTSNAEADLAGSGISVPRFGDYAERLVRFMRDHPELSSAAMA